MAHRLISVFAAAAIVVSGAACGGETVNRTSTQSAKPSQGATKVTHRRLSVAMSDFKFAPTNSTAGAGKLKVTATNAGRQQHEFVLLRTDKAPGGIPVKGGKASESSSVGEISEQEPGKHATHTFTLKPGKYVFICNVDGHYKLGMRGALVVK
jgi:uncharacterized cupredoxin-like copper-binding protein